jgi:hypothetical protein
VFRETLLGPVEEDIQVDDEFDSSIPVDQRPDLVKECAALRTFSSIDELFQFIHFEDSPEWLNGDVRRVAGEAAEHHRNLHPTPENVNVTATKTGVLSTWALARVTPRDVDDLAGANMRVVAPGVVVVDCGDTFVVLEDGVVQGACAPQNMRSPVYV